MKNQKQKTAGRRLMIWGVVLIALPGLLGGFVGLMLSGATMYVETVISNTLLIAGYSYVLWGWASAIIGVFLLGLGIAENVQSRKIAERDAIGQEGAK